MRIYCSIPVWLRVALLWAALLFTCGDAFGQNPWYGIDSAEKVHSSLQTAIPIGQTITSGSPFKVKIATGTGQYFAKVPKPFPVVVESSAPNAGTPIEEFTVSAVSNDTLTLVARSSSIGTNLQPRTWVTGSTISIRMIGAYILQLQHRIDSLTLNSGTVSSIVFQSPLQGGTITSSGTVSIRQATDSGGGYMAMSDHQKLTSALQSLVVASPMTISGTTNLSLSMPAATDLASGYMSGADHLVLSGKYNLPDTSGFTGYVLAVLPNGTVGWKSAGSGTVTSVNVSGGLSGLAFSNGPITSTGTITLSGGSLGVTYGGTGATTAAQARVNLLPDTAGMSSPRKYLSVLPGGGIVWDTAVGSGGGGSGTVTSVDVAVPSVLSVSGGPITTNGTITLSYSGTALPVVNGGTGQTTIAAARKAILPDSTGNSGKALEVTAGGGYGWATVATGTVTSVGLSMPTGFTVSSSPVTGSGTIGVTLSSESANTVLAAPDGSSGPPSFRNLVVGDIPSLDVAQITSGAFPTVRGGTGIASPTIHKLLVGNGASAMTQLAVGATNTVLHGNTGADPSFSAVATGDITDSNVTAVKIATHAVDLTQQVSGILPAVNGGTGNGFTAFTGPTTSTKTFTLPNASATLAYLAGGQTFTGGLTINGGLTLGTALPLTSGGTGSTTQPAALKVLTPDSTGKSGKALGVVPGGGYDWITPGFASPMTTTGDVIYSSDNFGTATRLGIGTSGQVLTVTAGLPSWQTFSALTNPMTTTGDMIYSSSGSTPARLAAGTAAQFLIGGPAPAWGSTLLAAAAGLGTTSTDGLVLKDSTAATVGVTSQYSPRLRFTGNAWKSTATAASQANDWIVENQPITGTSSTSSSLVFSSQSNGGGYGAKFAIGSGGTLSLGGAQIFSSNSTLGSGVTGSSLTSVGTITTGTWHGSTVDETHGGTNQTMYAAGDILYASGANTLSTRSIGADNTILEAVSGTPNWVAPLNPYGMVFGSSAALTVGATSGYFSPFGVAQTSYIAEDATHQMLVVSPCRATNLYLQTNAAPGGGNSHTMTLRRSTNQGSTWSVTPLSVVITGGSATSAQDILDTVSLNAGDLISLEDYSTVSSSATAGTWGMHLIEPTNISGVYNTVTASTSVGTDQMLSLAGTSVVTATSNTPSMTTGSSVSTYVGRVAWQYTGSISQATITVTIDNTKVTANSVIMLSCERDNHSPAGIEYVANLDNSSARVAGTSFQMIVQKKTTGTIAQNEGCTINYIIIN